MEKNNWLWIKWCIRVYTGSCYGTMNRQASRAPGALTWSWALMEARVSCWPGPFFSSGISPHFQDAFPLTTELPISLLQRDIADGGGAMSPSICGIKGNKSCKILILEVYIREVQSLSSEPWNGCQRPASAIKKGPPNAVRFAPSAMALSDSYGPVHIHWKLASGNDIQFDNIRCLGFLAQVRCSELIALWAEFQLWSVPWDISCVWLRKKGKEWKLISRKVSDEQHLSLKGKMGIISLSV